MPLAVQADDGIERNALKPLTEICALLTLKLGGFMMILEMQCLLTAY